MQRMETNYICFLYHQHQGHTCWVHYLKTEANWWKLHITFGSQIDSDDKWRWWFPLFQSVTRQTKIWCIHLCHAGAEFQGEDIGDPVSPSGSAVARNIMTTSRWIMTAHALISVYTIFKITGSQISVTLCSVVWLAVVLPVSLLQLHLEVIGVAELLESHRKLNFCGSDLEHQAKSCHINHVHD